jgi:hypothetical protein
MSILNYGSQPIEGKEATLQLATLNQGKQSQWNSQWGNPRVDLNLAYFVSLKVAESILSVKTNPIVQWQLARNLEMYQGKLVERETEFVNELLETVRKRDQAKKSTGVFGFISRSIIGGYHNWRANSKFQQYQGNEHFQKILKLYDSSTDQITRPHRDWYNITTPQLKINQVPKQLIISTQTTPGSYTIGNRYVQRAS